MTDTPRALTARQVVVCESAATRRCRCRCGGALHGAQRSMLPEHFEQLPKTDPHWLKEKSRQLPLPAPIGVTR